MDNMSSRGQVGDIEVEAMRRERALYQLEAWGRGGGKSRAARETAQDGAADLDETLVVDYAVASFLWDHVSGGTIDRDLDLKPDVLGRCRRARCYFVVGE